MKQYFLEAPRFWKTPFIIVLAITSLLTQGQPIEFAELVVKIPLVKKTVCRPMSVAYSPVHHRYYVADGGISSLPDSLTHSPCQVHTFDDQGHYLQSVNVGLDNRAIYFDAHQNKLATVTYNVSGFAGFAPNTGIFFLETKIGGDLTGKSQDIIDTHPAFGDQAVIPSFDPKTQHYFAKQNRSNKVFEVDLKETSALREIALDLPTAQTSFDDINHHFIAWTERDGEELLALDVEHNAVLIFDKTGRFVGKSNLPKTLKLHAQNYISGLSYANQLFFIYVENEGKLGTFYGFKVLK